MFAILGDKSLGSPPIATFTRTGFFHARAAITRPYGRIQYALRVTRVTNEPPVIGTDFRLDIIDVVKSFEQNVKTVIGILDIAGVSARHLGKSTESEDVCHPIAYGRGVIDSLLLLPAFACRRVIESSGHCPLSVSPQIAVRLAKPMQLACYRLRDEALRITHGIFDGGVIKLQLIVVGVAVRDIRFGILLIVYRRA